MTKTSNVLMIAAVTTVLAGSAFAQSDSAEAVKKDDHMASGAMVSGKKGEQMPSSAMASGQKDEQMKPGAMATGDKMKAKKKKDDRMASEAMPGAPKP